MAVWTRFLLPSGMQKRVCVGVEKFKQVPRFVRRQDESVWRLRDPERAIDTEPGLGALSECLLVGGVFVFHGFFLASYAVRLLFIHLFAVLVLMLNARATSRTVASGYSSRSVRTRSPLFVACSGERAPSASLAVFAPCAPLGAGHTGGSHGSSLTPT